MARFLGRVVSERGYEVHRLGHHTVSTECTGWDLGVKVAATVNTDNEDVFTISITKGSNCGAVKTTIVINKDTLMIHDRNSNEIFCRKG